MIFWELWRMCCFVDMGMAGSFIIYLLWGHCLEYFEDKGIRAGWGCGLHWWVPFSLVDVAVLLEGLLLVQLVIGQISVERLFESVIPVELSLLPVIFPFPLWSLSTTVELPQVFFPLTCSWHLPGGNRCVGFRYLYLYVAMRVLCCMIIFFGGANGIEHCHSANVLLFPEM